MATHYTLAWKILWTEEPGSLQSMGCEESDTTEQLHFHFSLSCIGEGNGNPLQCSFLAMESHGSLDPREGKRDTAATARVKAHVDAPTRVED